jgi:hypothetical protein
MLNVRFKIQSHIVYIYLYNALVLGLGAFGQFGQVGALGAFGADSGPSHCFALVAPFFEAFRSSPLEPNALRRVTTTML